MEDISSPEGIFGDSVRLYRKEMGWSQADLAKAMRERGFDWLQTTVSKTEAAERPIRLNEAVAVASLFGVGVTAMLNDRPDLEERRLRTQHIKNMTALNAAEAAKDQAEIALAKARAAVQRTAFAVDRFEDEWATIVLEEENHGEHQTED